MPKSKKLVEIRRNDVIERVHMGFACVIDSNAEVLFKAGDFDKECFLLRSAQKPFQSLMILKSNAFQKFNFEQKHLALCCASHSGTKLHTDTVLEILNKISLDETFLKCGSQVPLDEESKNNLIKNGIEPSVLHNNCSGKHSGMLAVCVKKGYDTGNYLDIEHPLQQNIIKTTKEICNFSEKTPVALDGCGAPVIGLPLANIAFGFINLLEKNTKLIIDACISNPVIFGGKGRFDSEIIEISQGKLFAKVGAEGLCVVLNTNKKQALVVKIEDGNNFARAIFTIDCLKNLDWISDEEYSKFSSIYSKKIFTRSGLTAGEIITLFD